MDAPHPAPDRIVVAPSGPVPDDVERILRGLPAWFGIDEANAEYVEAARRLPTYVATEAPGAERPSIAGVCLVEHHNEHSSEIHLLAVDHAHHRRGIGRSLLQRVEQDLAREGREFLQVKTLGSAHPSPEYAATRLFYEALGYRALQEFPADEMWPGNPCLVMVKALTSPTPTAETS
jgi:ribosomal protein S18 acetylase RimI-like enzyme